MLIRPLTRDDLPEVLVINNQTFSHDELFEWLFPRQDDYPDHLRRWQMIRLRTRLVTAGEHGFVAVSDETDSYWDGKPAIVGFAFFVRHGSDAASSKWKHDSLFNKLERHLLSWEMWYHVKIVERALDPSRIQLMHSLSPDDILSAMGPSWHVGILGVSPKYQRRGIGRKLVEFGQQLATDDSIPMTLESSLAGRALYRKVGFKLVHEFPLVEGFEGNVMVWEPEHLKGKWLEEEDDERARIKA